VDGRLPEVGPAGLLGGEAEQLLDLAVDVLAGAADLELLAVDDAGISSTKGPEAALGLLALDQLLLGGGVQAGVVEAIETTSAKRLTWVTSSSVKVRPSSEKARPITP
jgi:hypothetical protein